MDPEEERLRERGGMIDRSYAFWDKRVCEALERIESFDKYEDAAALKMEEELQNFFRRANFEKKELDKLERDVRDFIKRNEEKRKE